MYTSEQLETLINYIQITRDEANKILLGISESARDVTSDMSFSKAFTSMADAMMFLNVAASHFEHAYNFSQQGHRNATNTESQTDATSTECECNPEQVCIVQDTEGDS